ncbi:hypothetical protein Tco_0255739 [Tanacetum coccineum]
MLEEYNHYITFRDDPLPITKIRCRVNNSTKEASMRIIKDNQPLNLTIYDRIVLKMLGFGEWLEVHALASKVKSKSNNLLLKNLKAKFQWLKTQGGKLGILPPPHLTAFELPPTEKKVGMKRKRRTDLIHEVFVKKNIIMDGMQRNLTLPEGVVGKAGMVIKEPEAEIFLYNGNFDLVFQRRSEYALASTPQLIRIQNQIKIDYEYDQQVYDELIYETELAECKASTSNEDLLSAKHQRAVKGLVECKASASNLRRIQVKDIVKEVEYILKTYSSAGMDITWRENSIKHNGGTK